MKDITPSQLLKAGFNLIPEAEDGQKSYSFPYDRGKERIESIAPRDRA